MIDRLPFFLYYENQEGVFRLRRLLPELLVANPSLGMRPIAKQRMTNCAPCKGKDLADCMLAHIPSGTQQNLLSINPQSIVDFKPAPN